MDNGVTDIMEIPSKPGGARPTPAPKPRVLGVKPVNKGKQPPLPKKPPVAWKPSTDEAFQQPVGTNPSVGGFLEPQTVTSTPSSGGDLKSPVTQTDGPDTMVTSDPPTPVLSAHVPPPVASRVSLPGPVPPRPAARTPAASSPAPPLLQAACRKPRPDPPPSADGMGKQEPKRVSPPLLKRLSQTRSQKMPKPATKPKPKQRRSLFYVKPDESSTVSSNGRNESSAAHNGTSSALTSVNHALKNSSRFFVDLEFQSTLAAGSEDTNAPPSVEGLSAEAKPSDTAEEVREEVSKTGQSESENYCVKPIQADIIGSSSSSLTEEPQIKETTGNNKQSTVSPDVEGLPAETVEGEGSPTPLRPPRLKKGRKSEFKSQDSVTSFELTANDSRSNSSLDEIAPSTEQSEPDPKSDVPSKETQSTSQTNAALEPNCKRSESVPGKRQPNRKAPPPPARLKAAPVSSRDSNKEVPVQNVIKDPKVQEHAVNEQIPAVCFKQKREVSPTVAEPTSREGSPGVLSSESSVIKPTTKSQTGESPTTSPRVCRMLNSESRDVERPVRGRDSSPTPGKLNIKDIAANMGISISKGLQHQLSARTRPKPAPKPAPKPKPPVPSAKPEMRPAYKREGTEEGSRKPIKKDDAPLTIRAGSDEVRITRNPSYSKALDEESENQPYPENVPVGEKSETDGVLVLGVTTSSSNDGDQPVVSLADATVSSTDTDQPEISAKPVSAETSKSAGAAMDKVLPVDVKEFQSKVSPGNVEEDAGDRQKEKNGSDVVIPDDTVAQASPSSVSTGDLAVMRKRSNTVEVLLSVEGDGVKPTEQPHLRKKSNSATDLVDTGHESDTLRRAKPVFVPPPPPPYSPDSRSNKIIQTTSDEVFVEIQEGRRKDLLQNKDGSDNEYEEVMVMNDEEDEAVADSSPPCLPPKQSIRKPSTPTDTAPPRPPRRGLRPAPPPPIQSPPSTPPSAVPPQIPPRNKPTKEVLQQLSTQRSQSEVYDPEGYLEPVRDSAQEGDVYSYADLPGYEHSSPKKSKSGLQKKPPLPPMETKPTKELMVLPPAAPVEARKRDSSDSFSSHSSHIYEPIGSRSSSISMAETPASGERRVSEGRSTFYFPADDDHKAEVELLSPKTSKSPKSPKTPSVDIEESIPEETAVKPSVSSKDSVDIDVSIPPPQAPPRAKRGKAALVRQSAEDGLQSGHSSDSDYIYPDDPDFVKQNDSMYNQSEEDLGVLEQGQSVDQETKNPMATGECIYHEAEDPPFSKEEAIYHEAEDPPVDQTEAIYHEADDSAIESASASTSEMMSPVSPPPPVPPRDRWSEPAPHAILAALQRAPSAVSDSRVVLERSASRSVQFNMDPIIKSDSQDSALSMSPSGDTHVYEDTDSDDSFIDPETDPPGKTGTIIQKQLSLTETVHSKTISMVSQSSVSSRPQSWGSSVYDYDDTILPLQDKSQSEDGISQASSFLEPSSFHMQQGSGSSINSDLSDITDTEEELSEQKQLEKTKKKIHSIAKEILSSEESFVDILKLLNIDFRTSVDAVTAKHDHAVLPANILNQVLQYLPQLQNFNEDLLKDIRPRVENWDTDPRIADIFLKKGPFLKMYTFYMREFENSIAAFDDARKKYPEFHQAVKEFEASPRCKNLQLKHYMLAPIQRIPRYRLLLQEYQKHLTPESPDYKDTEAALVIINEVADHANESMKYGDNFRRLWDIQSTLIGEFEVIIPGREFIKEGMLKKLSRKVMQPRKFFLFSDTLLYTTPVSGGYKLNSAIPLAGMRVSLPTKEDFQNEFSILSTQRSFTISASTPEERDQWLETLKEAVRENMKRRSSFDVRKLTQLPNILVEVDKDFKLGTRAPVWVPDARVSMCMLCTAEFSVTFRRHHCRACGKVVCGFCSDYRAPLRYLKYKAARVCLECYKILAKEVDEMDEVPRDIPCSPGDGNDPDSPFSKASIKSRFKGISWSSFRKASKARRPAVLQEVSANDDNAEMSGYLKVFKSRRWKKLWFVLKGKALYTYKASEDTAAMESTVLLGYEVRTFNTWYEGVEPSLVFQISHKGTSPLVFRTESPASRDKWLHAMRDATMP